MRRGIAVGALAVTILTAMPMNAATAAKPSRDPMRGAPTGPSGSFVIREGQWSCPITVLVEFESRVIHWLFSDGRDVLVSTATITFTNVKTGTSYVQRSDYRSSIRTAGDGTEVEVIDGSRWMGFLRGDQGPEGVVGRGGSDYFVTGHQSLTYDPKRDVITSYESNGQTLDACEVLA